MPPEKPNLENGIIPFLETTAAEPSFKVANLILFCS
jgi:hypothetical protein